MEQAVRDEGGCPATIAIVDGRPRVGLEADDVDRLASGGVAKAGLSDLAPLVAAGRTGATTVAATAFLAARAGLEVFATGGIGGVHRSVGETLDVSGDLVALARTPIAVVCAGAKAILDLPRTFELLETLGVPLLGLGTDEFPAFYTRRSGLALEHVAPDAGAAARALAAHRDLGLATAVLFLNPPPRDSALDADEVEGWIERATHEAGRAGVGGKALTPWLLSRLAELSEGRTVRANVDLLIDNARAAARIAVALGSRRRPPGSGR